MAKTARVRPNTTDRVPLHEQKKNLLTVPEKKGFVRRFVNDVEQGQRVKRFLRAGWRIVEDETKVGDPGALNQNQSLGTGIRKHMGDTTYAVLMEIEKEFYDEDQAAKMDRLDQIEKSIYKDHGVRNSYGEIGHSVDIYGENAKPRRYRTPG